MFCQGDQPYDKTITHVLHSLTTNARGNVAVLDVHLSVSTAAVNRPVAQCIISVCDQLKLTHHLIKSGVILTGIYLTHDTDIFLAVVCIGELNYSGSDVLQ